MTCRVSCPENTYCGVCAAKRRVNDQQLSSSDRSRGSTKERVVCPRSVGGGDRPFPRYRELVNGRHLVQYVALILTLVLLGSCDLDLSHTLVIDRAKSKSNVWTLEFGLHILALTIALL